MNEQLQLAIPEPAAAKDLGVVVAFTNSLEAWASQVDDVAELEATRKKVAAIESYLRGEDPHAPAYAELARADRRLEVRIGELLGPAEPGRRTDLAPGGQEVRDPIPPKRKAQLRKMAATKDEPPVAAAIEAGASRAEVLRRADEVQPRMKGPKPKTRFEPRPAKSTKIQPPKRCPMCGGTGTV